MLGASRGDFAYTLALLPPGAVFYAGTAYADGQATLLSRGKSAGSELSLALDGLSPDSVTVEYLRDGVPVAAPYVHRLSAARTESSETFAGSAEEGPTSYHYEWRDGERILVKDYNVQSSGSARLAGGTWFTTVGGERARVTHVAFRLHGLGPAQPEEVRFSSPVAFSLDGFELAP